MVRLVIFEALKVTTATAAALTALLLAGLGLAGTRLSPTQRMAADGFTAALTVRGMATRTIPADCAPVTPAIPVLRFTDKRAENHSLQTVTFTVHCQ